MIRRFCLGFRWVSEGFRVSGLSLAIFAFIAVSVAIICKIISHACSVFRKCIAVALLASCRISIEAIAATVLVAVLLNALHLSCAQSPSPPQFPEPSTLFAKPLRTPLQEQLHLTSSLLTHTQNPTPYARSPLKPFQKPQGRRLRIRPRRASGEGTRCVVFGVLGRGALKRVNHER